MDAEGNISCEGMLDLKGVGGGNQGGDGGTLGISALDGYTLLGGIVRLNATSGTSDFGAAGEVDIDAGGNITLTGTIDQIGPPAGNGGYSYFSAGLDLVQNGTILCSSQGVRGDGGSVEFDAGRTLTLGNITCTGGDSGVLQNYVYAEALCDVRLVTGRTIDTRGPRGDNTIVSGAPITINGRMLSAANTIQFGQTPPVIGQGALVPATPGACSIRSRPLPASRRLRQRRPRGDRAVRRRQHGRRRRLRLELHADRVRQRHQDRPARCDDGNAPGRRRLRLELHPHRLRQQHPDPRRGMRRGQRERHDRRALQGQLHDSPSAGLRRRHARPTGEQCDDGANANPCDGCSDACLTTGCGNGNLEAACGEQCDDQNTESGDGCSSTCQTEALRQRHQGRHRAVRRRRPERAPSAHPAPPPASSAGAATASARVTRAATTPTRTSATGATSRAASRSDAVPDLHHRRHRELRPVRRHHRLRPAARLRQRRLRGRRLHAGDAPQLRRRQRLHHGPLRPRARLRERTDRVQRHHRLRRHRDLQPGDGSVRQQRGAQLRRCGRVHRRRVQRDRPRLPVQQSAAARPARARPAA